MENINFSGIKDVDKKILQSLDDRDLISTCMVSKYTDSLCQDDKFWINRFINYYGEDSFKQIKSLKPKNWSWKRYYLYSLTLEEKDFMESINDYQEISYFPGSVSEEWKEEVFYDNKEGARKFYLSRLPVKAIYISYPITFLENIYEERVYKISSIVKNDDKILENEFFTPYTVMNLISNFYDETLTVEEYRKNLETGNPYAKWYSEEKVKSGKVRRGDMLPEVIYEGLFYDVEYAENPDYRRSSIANDGSEGTIYRYYEVKFTY